MLKWFKKKDKVEETEAAEAEVRDAAAPSAAVQEAGESSEQAAEPAAQDALDEPDVRETAAIDDAGDVPKNDATHLPEGELGEAEGESEPGETGLFSKLRRGLNKTQGALVGGLKSAIGLHGTLDEEVVEEIEAVLLQGDVGFRSTEKIIERIRKAAPKQGALDVESVIRVVEETIEQILSQGQRELELTQGPPAIVLVVGVNGTGKTTTIGKIALELTRQGKKVLMIAADTFRAAASEQLAIWAERAGAGLVSSEREGADPGSVCFEGLSEAKRASPDVVLIDTAGRLHTKTRLMDELGKIVRVMRKVYPDAPHETILVLDATTGQNALNQVRVFGEATELTGLVMTKLDGTAKGGILVAIKEAHPKLPIFKIGIGEEPEDLRDFDARDFAAAIFEGEN